MLLRTAIPRQPPCFIVSLDSMEIVEGDAARFYCKANGYPVPEILWRRSGKEITRDNRFTIHHMQTEDDSESTLIVVDVLPEVAGTVTAEAINDYGRATTRANLHGMCMLTPLTVCVVC